MSYSISSFAGAGAQFFDNNGSPLVGGQLFVYTAGTTTPATTWTDNSGATANTNPIVLDSAGRTTNEIWLDGGLVYKFVLKTSASVLIGTYDNIPAIATSASFNNLIVVTGTNSLIGTATPPFTAIVAGTTASFVVVNTNTGAVTLDIDGTGARDVTSSGSSLSGGELVVGQIAQVEYDGSDWQLQSTSLSSALKADQLQTATAVTTSGTLTAYTATPSPAVTAYTTNLSLFVEFHVASGAAPTLQINGVATPPALVKQDTTGAYVAIAADDIPLGHHSKVTLISPTQAWVENLEFGKASATNAVLTGIPTLNGNPLMTPPVRQTVLNGPVDSSGFPAFGGSTGSTVVTCTGSTLTVTAANGFTTTGQLDRTGAITAPSWTGLSTNGTMYLYVDVAADGTCTTGSTTLAPIYQNGGTYSTTFAQFTFNTVEMVGKVGNGATATQTYRVFVGQVTVASGTVSTIVWYALRGAYDSGWTATLPSAGANTSKSHNLGMHPEAFDFCVECTTTDNGYSVGKRLTTKSLNSNDGAANRPLSVSANGTSVFVQAGLAIAFQASQGTTGGFFSLANASWKYKVTAQRGW